MPGTIIDYIKEYKNITFAKEPMSDVDSLVLCQLAYLKFDGIVPDATKRRKAISVQEIAAHENYENLYGDTRYEKDNRALFENIIKSKRYRRLKVNYYMNIIVNEWETQFCAVTFFLDDGTPYIAFRGTDETIVGWKEDFNMSFLSPVPGQNYSLHYLTHVASKLRKPFYVGGHSKGGNLAIYA